MGMIIMPKYSQDLVVLNDVLLPAVRHIRCALSSRAPISTHAPANGCPALTKCAPVFPGTITPLTWASAWYSFSPPSSNPPSMGRAPGGMCPPLRAPESPGRSALPESPTAGYGDRPRALRPPPS